MDNSNLYTEDTPKCSVSPSRSPQSFKSPSIDSTSTYCESRLPKQENSGISKPDPSHLAYEAFLRVYPEYKLTWKLDILRETDFSRLDKHGETYVDYMGGAIYPERLVRAHSAFLQENIFGNTHSVSNSSRASASCANLARQAVLDYFHAPIGYSVIFTPNATGALKLVGESFPFTDGSEFVLGIDSHNSVHGIRQFATDRKARVTYINSTKTGGINERDAKRILYQRRPRLSSAGQEIPCLYAQTGQSNISNAKTPLSTLTYAASLGYCTVLDAAALAPTSFISLADQSVDAMAVSFYKMFGYPTGCGCLIVKDNFLRLLQRPWFAGGNVHVVQVPGTIVTRSLTLPEQFEDGTMNYLSLPAITAGLTFLSDYMSIIQLRYPSSGKPVVQILSRLPKRKPKIAGEQSDTGYIVSLIFLQPSGEMMPNSFIEHAATLQNISLRTGCMCNPGGAAAILDLGNYMEKLYPGVTLESFEQIVGHELGVVRISLGLASTFNDVWNVLRFAITIGFDDARKVMWENWTADTMQGHVQGR